MMRTIVQLQGHDVYNCTIKAQIRAVDDQSDLTILIISYDYDGNDSNNI